MYFRSLWRDLLTPLPLTFDLLSLRKLHLVATIAIASCQRYNVTFISTISADVMYRLSFPFRKYSLPMTDFRKCSLIPRDLFKLPHQYPQIYCSAYLIDDVILEFEELESVGQWLRVFGRVVFDEVSLGFRRLYDVPDQIGSRRIKWTDLMLDIMSTLKIINLRMIYEKSVKSLNIHS